MPTPVFALEATDLKKRLNSSNLPSGFMGSQSSIVIADVEETLLASEEKLLGELSERQRQLMRRIDGEIIVPYATAGQTTARLGLSPVSNVTLFKNWNFRTPWNPMALHLAMSENEFTVVDEATGDITFAPLDDRNTLVAVYDHSAGSKMHHLRSVVLDYSAASWALYVSSYSDQVKQMWEDRRRISYGEMRALAEGKNGGLDVLDNLILARETRSPSNEPGQMPILGGW